MILTYRRTNSVLDGSLIKVLTLAPFPLRGRKTNTTGLKVTSPMQVHSLPLHSHATWLPGHQPEMPDTVKLLLTDASYYGFHTLCLL